MKQMQQKYYCCYNLVWQYKIFCLNDKKTHKYMSQTGPIIEILGIFYLYNQIQRILFNTADIGVHISAVYSRYMQYIFLPFIATHTHISLKYLVCKNMLNSSIMTKYCILIIDDCLGFSHFPVQYSVTGFHFIMSSLKEVNCWHRL